MTISPELMQAILSMDSYNRGYNAGIVFGADPTNSEAINGITKLGEAVVYRSLGNEPAQSIGFYAIAYSYGGSTVISYRGTDDMIVEWNNEAQEWQTSLDVNNGYDVGAGIADTPQSRMSFEFYRAVADALNNNNPADPYAANISVTGHSLGAGFAGLVGAIGGRSGGLVAL